MDLKPSIENYTEAEFLACVSLLFRNDSTLQGEAYGAWKDRILLHLVSISEHPNGFNLICFPLAGEDDTPEGVVKRVKEWRTANNKPGFKPA
ncbi:bacteriocin immunity protein [Pseudomonas huaxiensis]|uniref:bacteriocin immunity protein n=1 Tax=Pseudomonas huaxiensis TaxID=2213017 RepID=UPI000DA6A036|nr:bacteriocin immunity protein [Pseudomonas huaxiensis]